MNLQLACCAPKKNSKGRVIVLRIKIVSRLLTEDSECVIKKSNLESALQNPPQRRRRNPLSHQRINHRLQPIVTHRNLPRRPRILPSSQRRICSILQQKLNEIHILKEGRFTQRVSQGRVIHRLLRDLIDVGVALLDEHLGNPVSFPRDAAVLYLGEGEAADGPLEGAGAVGVGAVFDEGVGDGELRSSSGLPDPGGNGDVREEFFELEYQVL